MTTTSAVGCARCGTILDPGFRFCPECGLPASGDSVLSTEIGDVRQRVEARSSQGARPASRPSALLIGAAAMSAFVIALGFVLFDRQLLNRVLPTEGGHAASGAVASTPTRWEPEWVQIPVATLPYGDPAEHRTGEVPYPFLMSK